MKSFYEKIFTLHEIIVRLSQGDDNESFFYQPNHLSSKCVEF